MFARSRPPAESEVLAAVDLGSNSFHMIVARLSHGQLTVIDRLREMVQLAAGLDRHNRLDPASQERALACLSRFGERIRDMHASRVRVVGTNTLRRARGARVFFQRAAQSLGHPIDVISGIEEARLVYLGAYRSLPSIEGADIVIDIGGGSTEVIRGENGQPRVMESLYLGCVGMSEDFFQSGKLGRKRFERARLAARLEFQPLRARFVATPPSRFVGSSGTIRAVSRVLEAREDAPQGITLAAVERLIDAMIDAGKVDNLAFEGLSVPRKAVFPGGVVILAEAMAALNVDCLFASEGSLREGILYDMIGRLTDEDARERTVRSLEGRFNIDHAQADRVERTATWLFDQVCEGWQLDDSGDRQLLAWAARLHEMGLDIAHAGYHHHGAYLLEHADMPGFTRTEQLVLARLVEGHRRSPGPAGSRKLPGGWDRTTKRLGVLLRLAVLFQRSRTDSDLPPVECRVKGRSVRLRIPATWLDANSLTAASLQRERKYLADADFMLDIEAV